MTAAPPIPMPHQREVWRAYSETLRPLERLTPDEFAVKHRILHSVYCSEHPGPWDNTVFPYQRHVMNAVQEAIETGRRGVVFMKAGQIGGTDCMINAMLWLKTYYPGPQLFLTSIEKVANEFGRERFHLVIPDMEPLRRRAIPSGRPSILVKRFYDGKIQLAGGKSVNALQSTPYRFVIIDELDSLVENLGGSGDPLKLAENRTDSFTGQTLIIAYAHPSTRDRGAAKLYYDHSDQRRGFITHDCGHSFYPQWQHVRAIADGKSQAQADVDPDAYADYCPGCGSIISDAQRVAMVRNVEYRSTLPPEQAAKKAWIGVHANQLYSPAKTIHSFAQRWIECGDDENAKRVFSNKILGEPYEPKVQKVDISALRALIVVQRRPNDPEFYSRGQVPPGVRFLTAGQDSRTVELHYAIWGWGLRRAIDDTVSLCGWLIDWGCIARAYSLMFSEAEYHVFDDLIYRRSFPSSTITDKTYNVMACGHDVGYPPTQIPITAFCRHWPNRAVPVKGASLTHTSSSTAPYARWGAALKFKAGETEVKDDASRHLQLNTFMLKTDLYGWMQPDKKIEIADMVGSQIIGTRKVSRLTFPEDVDDRFLEESKNEILVRGKKNGELVWDKSGPNHYADTTTYSLGLAYQLDPFQKGQTAEEYQTRRKFVRPGAVPAQEHDASMG